PIERPTAVDPVNPTLSTVPASRAASRPAKVSAPAMCSVFSTSAGTPPACISEVSASATAFAVSDGFQTTAFPHTSAGTTYHEGTAAGKLPAVITAATPTGTRK